MADPIQELEDDELDVEYQTPSTSEVDIENNTTDNQSDEQQANVDQYDVLTRTFRDYYTNEITETFADELDDIRKKEAFFGPDKLQILSDCLAQGVNLFTQVEKELYLIDKLSNKKQTTSEAVTPSKLSTQTSASTPTNSKSASTPSKAKAQTPTPKEQDAMDVEEEEEQPLERKKEKKKKKHKREDSTSNGNT